MWDISYLLDILHIKQVKNVFWVEFSHRIVLVVAGDADKFQINWNSFRKLRIHCLLPIKKNIYLSTKLTQYKMSTAKKKNQYLQKNVLYLFSTILATKPNRVSYVLNWRKAIKEKATKTKEELPSKSLNWLCELRLLM